jgi:amidase
MSPTRREFVAGAVAAGASVSLPRAFAVVGTDSRPSTADSPQLDEITIAQLQDLMRSKATDSAGITGEYLARINARNAALHAVIELNPDARTDAAARDADRQRGDVKSPLHGVPILLKDNIATSDRMQTTAGSLALAGSRVPRDAFIAGKLRAAGVVFLGKANLSEWANFRSTHSTSGWSARGGQARNPYALDRTTSGSSSGSGAAVAGNLCAFAIGTETDGSIVDPSSRCSIVGIKPTVGLVSRSGIIPISHSQDTAGPMARTVTDAAIVLGVIAGEDPRDPATAAARGHIAPDYTKFLDAKGLAGARIGVPRPHYYGYSPKADALVDAAIKVMRDAGAIIIDPAPIETAGKMGKPEYEVLLYEFKADLNAYLADLAPGANARTLADLIAFNEAHRAQEMPFFGQEIFLESQAKGPLTDKAYLDARAECIRLARTEGIDATMDKYDLDALIAPTAGPPTPIDLVNGDADGGGSSTPAAIAGYPSITVPAGYAFGLPVGVSFFGRAWSEPTLIKLAYAYEQASKMRRPPRFLATAEL